MTVHLSFEVTRYIDAPPDKVASWFCDFSRMSRWHPLVVKSDWVDLETMRDRVLVLASGDELVERLLESTPSQIQYTIIQSPHSIKNYVATLMVQVLNGRTLVRWSTEVHAPNFETGEMIQAGFSHFYRVGLDGLANVAANGKIDE